MQALQEGQEGDKEGVSPSVSMTSCSAWSSAWDGEK